ncbi:MAG TPA: PAS domain S-box protein, partial [Verrucomicrobiae bacterium]|nr:PAS domain S-box protein [Verrucomicrobiae bacterium]
MNPEQALRESEVRIRAILENAADGIMTADERGIIQSFNPAAALIFGYSPVEAIGQNIRQLIPRPYLREHESYRPPGTPTSSVISLGREVVGRHKEGRNFPLDLSVSEMFTGTKRLYTAIVRDITERKRAQEELTNSREQLRSLAARLESIREEERTRISREIHDELGQSLTGVKMDLSWLANKLPENRKDLADRIKSTTR